MRPFLLAPTIIMPPMTAAGWLGWVLREEPGLSPVVAPLVAVAFGAPLARLAQGADPAGARARP